LKVKIATLTVSHISAKYYLNWFSYDVVIMKVIGVDFFETQCLELRNGHFIFKAANMRRQAWQKWDLHPWQTQKPICMLQAYSEIRHYA